MIIMKLGELYGCDNYDELWTVIELLKNIGMPDEEINKILERSETKYKKTEN